MGSLPRAHEAIPYEEMVSNDYDKFLEKRAEMVRLEMSKLCL